MKHGKTILGCMMTLSLSGTAFAQAQPPAAAPITTGAGVGNPPINSFPGSSAVGPANNVQPYQAPRPGLSPYLNLGRNGNRGFSAVDYYNFVRPAQQSLGSYSGRQPGPYNPSPRYGNSTNIEPDVQLDPDAQLRSAGTAATFMNTGRYFNSLGTMGQGARTQQPQQQRSPTMGRR